MEILSMAYNPSESQKFLSQPYECRYCGGVARPVVQAGSGPHHASAHCRFCARFVRWLPKPRPEAEASARRDQYRQEAMRGQPPSPAQLRYLRTLSRQEVLPGTMAEASQRIDTLVQERKRA
jgi:hypothetical protein